MSSPPLSLAQRLLLKLGEIAARGDVTIHRKSGSWSGPIKRWEPVLPADMYAFYRALNGLTFYYAFTDRPDDWHGFRILSLDQNGKGTIDAWSARVHLRRQAVKRYPKHFFQEGALAAETPALFFLGSDDAWGVIMTGEGENTSFYHWDNDGFVRYLTGSFTELIDRLIDRGFAHTWAYADQHPDTDAVVARLAQPAPAQRYAVRVLERSERPEQAHRAEQVAALSPETLKSALRALGASKAIKLPRKEQEAQACALLEEHAGDPVKVAKVMKAVGYGAGKQTEAGLRERFFVGMETLVTLRLEVEALEDGLVPDYESEAEPLLVRVLQSCPGVDLSVGYTEHAALLRYVPVRRWPDFTSPFLSFSAVSPWGARGARKGVFEVLVPEDRAAGLIAGARLISPARRHDVLTRIR